MSTGSAPLNAYNSSAAGSRIKRKPPPQFPFSSKYPAFDTSDPFAPLALLRSRAESSLGRYTSDSEGWSDAHNAARPNSRYLYPDRPAMDRYHSDVVPPPQSDTEPARFPLHRRSQSVVLTQGHPNARDSRLFFSDFRTSQVLTVEPASPAPEESPVEQNTLFLTVIPPHVSRTPSPPAPAMTTDDGSASDASVHFVQRTHRRTPSAIAQSHRVSAVSFSASPTNRRQSFFAPSPATRGDMSPRRVDDFSPVPEDWRTPTNSERPSPVTGTFPPRRQTIAEGEVQSFVSEQSYWLPPRATEPRHRRREDEGVDIFPLAESPDSMHEDELALSAANRARAEACNAPKPSESIPPRPALNPKRLSSMGVPTARSSASSGHSKCAPSLKLRIPDGRTTLSTPSPVRMFLVPRPKLVATPSPTVDSPAQRGSLQTTESDVEGVVQVAQLAHWSPPPKPVPPPFPRVSVAGRSDGMERRASTVIQPAPPAPAMAHTASQPAAAPIRTTMIKAQAAKIAPTPRDIRDATRPRPSPSPPRAPSGKQARETELRRRTPSPPLRVPSPATRPPARTPSPAAPPPRSSQRPVPSRPEPSYARPTTASSSSRSEVRPPSPPRNRYLVQDTAPSRGRYEHNREASSASRLRDEERPAPRTAKASVAQAIAPGRTSPPVRPSSPAPLPPSRQASPPPNPAHAAAVTGALLPLQSIASATTLTSNRQLPPLPRAPPSTPAVPHFTEAVMAALERASPPEEEPAPIKAATVREEKAVAQKTSSPRAGSVARPPHRTRDFLVDPALVEADSVSAGSHQRTEADEDEFGTMRDDMSFSSSGAHRPAHKTASSSPAVGSLAFAPKPVPRRGMSDITILSVTSTIVDGSASHLAKDSKCSLRVQNPDDRRAAAQRAHGPPSDGHAEGSTPALSSLGGTVRTELRKKKNHVTTNGLQRSDTTTASTVHPSDASWEELSAKALATKDAITKAPLSTYRSIQAFEADTTPSRAQLGDAAALDVVAETGIRVRFGDLFRDRPTIVLFIRHFWCHHDQDYLYSVMKHVNFDALERANVGFVVVGCGSPAMIRAYRQIFRAPFDIYTDPTLQLHRMLGMTLRSNDGGPDIERGAYVRHGSVGGIAMVVMNALRVAMPVFEKGGDPAQLGGEFVFGPGLSCTYAHRMRYTRAHAPVLGLVAAAGLRPRDMDRQATSTGPLHATTSLNPVASRATYASDFSKQARRKSTKVSRAQISPPIPDTPVTPLAQKVAQHTPRAMTAMESMLSPAASTKAGVLSDDELVFQRERAMAEIARIQQRRERDRARGTGTAPRRKPLPAASPPSRAWTTDVETPTRGPAFERVPSDVPDVPAPPPREPRRDAPARARTHVMRARDENDFASRMYPSDTERPPPTPEKPIYAPRRAPQSARKAAGKVPKTEQIHLKPMTRELSDLTNGDTTDGGRDAREMWGRNHRLN